MMTGLGTFETLADAQAFRIREGNAEIGDGVKIIPLNDALCNGRLDCQGCTRLAEGIQSDTHRVLYLMPNDSKASFALCQRGNKPEEQKLLTIVYEHPQRIRTRNIMDFGSTKCPREHGEHAPI